MLNRFGVCMCSLLLAGSMLAPAALARDEAEAYYRAYYLETAEGDCAAAVKLYQDVAQDRGAPKELRAAALERMAGCREALASRDLAALMPPDALVYAELSQPGRQIARLLDQLGLLAHGPTIVKEGERKLAISPALIEECLGLGGAAIAVTGFNFQSQKPAGVLVINPGDLEMIRGIFETGLPAATRPVEPIDEFPTYDVEGEALVTLTSRLVIAGSDRAQIEGVIRRLTGKEKKSLASNGALRDLLADRDDALVTFFVNPQPVMPMLEGMVAAQAGNSQEIAMARALLDPSSLESVVGQLAVDDEGLALTLGLNLKEGHRNLVFNFLRRPAVDHDVLRAVPEGAAAVFLGSLNPADSTYRAAHRSGNGAPVVTALDIGREVFANITTFAVFALPPEDGRSEGAPVPDVAGVIAVHDPAQSQALWTQLLGIASLASGGATIEGAPATIEGVTARQFRLPDGISIYFAAEGNHVLVGPSRLAIARALKARRSGRSVVNDQALSGDLGRLSDATTQALFVHFGRAARLATPFMSPREAAEAAPIMELLRDTVATVVLDHSANRFRVSARVRGIPDVSGLVSQELTRAASEKESATRLTHAMRSGDWDAALAMLDASLAKRPNDIGLLRKRFDVLALGRKDRKAALACGERFLEAARKNPTSLNNMAWALLTEERYEGQYDELALALSQRCNEMTDHGNWMFVDTLALAHFRRGDPEAAVKLQRKAVELCGQCGGHREVEERLARFESAAADAALAQNAAP